MIKKIIELSRSRIKYLSSYENHEWYKWSISYFNWIIWEIEEAREENKENNTVYLEDELWDIFWDYMCLLNSLEVEWKINSIDKVFERAYKKFSWRVKNEWSNMWDWLKIKEKQKKELKKEHNSIYN